MLIRSAVFVKSAVHPDHYPTENLPEIAFAGRSNVGKSSLINTLVRRKRLVKTSNTPGRTRQINFFRVNEAFLLVDLPGYGYARVPASVRRSWKPMVEAYLAGRPVLKAAVVILDIRRIPGAEEKDLLAWLKTLGVAAVPVLTKADKLSASRRAVQHRRVAQTLAIADERLILFSAKTGMGREAVWEAILARMDGPADRSPAA